MSNTSSLLTYWFFSFYNSMSTSPLFFFPPCLLHSIRKIIKRTTMWLLEHHQTLRWWFLLWDTIKLTLGWMPSSNSIYTPLGVDVFIYNREAFFLKHFGCFKNSFYLRYHNAHVFSIYWNKFSHVLITYLYFYITR